MVLRVMCCLGAGGYLFACPLAFSLSARTGESSPGGGLGVVRHMDFRPRSASFNLFRRRLHHIVQDQCMKASVQDSLRLHICIKEQVANS